MEEYLKDRLSYHLLEYEHAWSIFQSFPLQTSDQVASYLNFRLSNSVWWNASKTIPCVILSSVQSSIITTAKVKQTYLGTQGMMESMDTEMPRLNTIHCQIRWTPLTHSIRRSLALLMFKNSRSHM